MISDPVELWLLRHGQSLGNVARDSARSSKLEVLDIADRDMDVPLSPLGAEQAARVRSLAAVGDRATASGDLVAVRARHADRRHRRT